MRENLIKEKHSGRLCGHFGVDKTTNLLNESYYWLGMSVDVKKMVQGCRICQHVKGMKQNTRLHISHYRFQRDCGNTLAWILFWDYLELSKVMIQLL